MSDTDSDISTTLRLVVPDFAAMWADARTAATPIDLPGLERAVRRGIVERAVPADPLWSPWQRDVLNGLNILADASHAVAPLEWLGSGGEPRRGTWLRGEFVHVAVGTHAARLHPVHLEREVAAQLRASLTRHFAATGWNLLAPADVRCIPGERFYLHTDRELESACPLPAFNGTDVREQLPQGRDGPELRRLFTEAQMLLHEHPVNGVRERTRLQPANAIWLSGCGAMRVSGTTQASIEATSIDTLWSDEPWVRGLAQLHGLQCLPLPENAADWLAVTDRGTAILSTDSGIALDVLEIRWFAPLIAAVAARRIGRLELALGSLEIHVDAAGLRRFWRRGRSLREWLP